MLQGGYPAKLKKVLIVTAPLWFKAPFKILRLFVREKLRDRVFTVSIPQVSKHQQFSNFLDGLTIWAEWEVPHATYLNPCHLPASKENLAPSVGSTVLLSSHFFLLSQTLKIRFYNCMLLVKAVDARELLKLRILLLYVEPGGLLYLSCWIPSSAGSRDCLPPWWKCGIDFFHTDYVCEWTFHLCKLCIGYGNYFLNYF